MSELQHLVALISERVGRHLERRGLLVRDIDNANLVWDDEAASALDELAGHSITCRIAVGPHRGQKAFTLHAIANSRLSLTVQSLVRYALKTPWRDGTTHVLLAPPTTLASSLFD